MPTWRWTLYDPVTVSTYELHINPKEGGTPGNKKNILEESTAGGATLLFEGRDTVKRLRCSGTILEQAHLEALQAQFDIRRQLLLTDDLGREFWVYIEDFDPKRIRSLGFPWRHDYDLTMIILDVP